MGNKIFELGDKQNKQAQLRLYDDYTFKIEYLETGDGLIIKKDNDEPIEAFDHRYKNMYFTEGYKDIPRCMLVPGYSRDSLLELHDVLNDDERPNKNNHYINNIAKNRAESLRRTPRESWKVTRITLAMFWVCIILALCIGLRVIL